MIGREEKFSFSKDVEPTIGLVNFCPPEDGFVWSSALWSEVKFPAIGPTVTREHSLANCSIDIALDIDVFKVPPNFAGQNVYFYVNGLRLASRFITTRITVMLELPGFMSKERDNLVTIETPDAARPLDHGLQDTRKLGIQLFGVRISFA